MTDETIKDLFYGNLNLFDRPMHRNEEYNTALHNAAETIALRGHRSAAKHSDSEISSGLPCKSYRRTETSGTDRPVHRCARKHQIPVRVDCKTLSDRRRG